jgi:Tfp pilus assembly protein PilV
VIRNNKGITLLEVLAATVILGLVVLTFVSISQYKLLSDQKTDFQVEALSIAQNQLNIMRADLINTNKTVPAETTVSTNQAYTIRYELIAIDASSISFSPIPSASNSVSLQSMIYHENKPKLLTVTVYWVKS